MNSNRKSIVIVAVSFLLCVGCSYFDEDPSSPADTVAIIETTVELCSDSLDNDANGLIDCLDSNCVILEVCSPTVDTTTGDAQPVESDSSLTDSVLVPVDSTVAEQDSTTAIVDTTVVDSGAIDTIPTDPMAVIDNSLGRITFSSEALLVEVDSLQPFTIYLDSVVANELFVLTIQDSAITRFTASKSVIGLTTGVTKVKIALLSDSLVYKEMLVSVYVSITSLDIHQSELFLNIGEQEQLRYNYFVDTLNAPGELAVMDSLASNQLSKLFTLSVENPNVALVGEDGIVVSVADGTTKIYVTYLGEVPLTDSVQLTVQPTPVLLKAIDEIVVPGLTLLDYSVIPTTADNGVSVVVEDSSIVSATASNGSIALSTVSAGTTTITIHSLVDPTVIKTVTVTCLLQPALIEILSTEDAVESVLDTQYIDPSTTEKHFFARTLPKGSVHSVNWLSGNPDVFTVTNGIVTPVAPGIAPLILVHTDDSTLVDTVIVTVTELSVHIEGETVIAIGDALSLTANVVPAGVALWSVNAPEIATIDIHSGVVTPVTSGMVTVRASIVDAPHKFIETKVTVVEYYSTMFETFNDSIYGWKAFTSAGAQLTVLDTLIKGRDSTGLKMYLNFDPMVGEQFAGIEKKFGPVNLCKLKSVALDLRLSKSTLASVQFKGNLFWQFTAAGEGNPQPRFSGRIDNSSLPTKWGSNSKVIIPISDANNDIPNNGWKNGCNSIGAVRLIAYCNTQYSSCDALDHTGRVFVDNIKFIGIDGSVLN